MSLAVATVFKVWLIFGGWVAFNSDEAIIALMARHILSGEKPLFFYGQAYMGSLDAFLVAGAFSVFGQHVWSIRIVQCLLFLIFLLTAFWLGKLAFGKWQVGAIGAMILAIPTVNVSLYTTVSLGGYAEALVIGNLILIAALEIHARWRQNKFPGPIWLWFSIGFLIGFGLWMFGLTLVFSLPAIAFLTVNAIKHLRKRQSTAIQQLTVFLGVLLSGILLGSAPWWIYALRNGIGVLFHELHGGAIANVEGLPWAAQIGQHLLSLLLFGSTAAFGLRPPWSVDWLGLPLLPFVLAFWLLVMVHIAKPLTRADGRQGRFLLGGVMVTQAFVFVFSPFGADPSGRYFLPLAAPLALFAGDLIFGLEDRLRGWSFGLLALLMVYQLWGNLQSALSYPPGLTTQFDATTQIDHRYDEALMNFLIEHNETCGYTNYWIAYPLAFLSHEQLIFTPLLPYHHDFRYTRRDDRYKPYDSIVERANRIAYITSLHPQLDAYLETRFSNLGISWREAWIGEFHIFYGLSRSVHPTEIGLGVTTHP